MSGFLLDTNVVSDPSKSKPNPGLRKWLGTADETTLYLSVLTLGELRSGIEQVSDAGKKAHFEAFLASLRARFAQRVLVFDHPVAERWGHLIGSLAKVAVKVSAIDGLIAATALEHDLTIVTRNDADFARCGVAVLNPFT